MGRDDETGRSMAPSWLQCQEHLFIPAMGESVPPHLASEHHFAVVAQGSWG